MRMQNMEPQRWFVTFGMISVIFFFAHIILGELLWNGYNPIQQSISELTADGAPNAYFLRILVALYEVCLSIFIVGLICIAFYKHNGYLRTGYPTLFITVLISIIGFNTFPMTITFIISLQNLAHTLVTILLLCLTILSVTLVSIGYIRKEKLKLLGWASLTTAILSTLFNLMLWFSALNGGNNFGLLERLTVYPFHVFTFMISWYYTQLLNSVRSHNFLSQYTE